MRKDQGSIQVTVFMVRKKVVSYYVNQPYEAPIGRSRMRCTRDMVWKGGEEKAYSDISTSVTKVAYPAYPVLDSARLGISRLL
jgi:hypothetical protein